MALGTFVHVSLPTRVRFGRGGRDQAGAEAERLALKRPLVLSGRQQAELGQALAARFGWPHWAGARMHTPVETTEQALAVFAAEGADGVIAFGGGSSIGLGKAIALRLDVPQICIPTTYAGSEMTNILGETAEGAKTTQRGPRIQPETVIYDPDLVDGLPRAMAAVSGLNAIAHAVEGLYAVDGTPLVSLMAEEGIRALAVALPAGDAEFALYGAWLCGAVLGSVSMALHHKLCHVLGGSFGLPHAETHAVVLPHATAYNAPATPVAMARLAAALGAPSAAAGLYDLALKLGAPTSLKALGLPESALDRAADLAAAAPYPNPRPLERAALRKLLQDAFEGVRPTEIQGG
jgi:alcohol dehydrogenase class IV